MPIQAIVLYGVFGRCLRACRRCEGGGVMYVPEGLKKILLPGMKIRVFFNKNNPNNQLRHIRAIIDDEYVVYRVWSRGKQSWCYHVEWVFGFILEYERGVLSHIK